MRWPIVVVVVLLAASTVIAQRSTPTARLVSAPPIELPGDVDSSNPFVWDVVDGVWYGYYHHERPADQCGRPDRQLPRLGSARSADRAIFHDGAWLPINGSPKAGWSYPAGTPLVPATRPFHDGSQAADVFWGASIHWNTYLEQYVMVVNRAKDEHFGTEGLYVSYAPSLSEPGLWSQPQKLMNGGEWYPQVVGLEAGSGTDRLAGRRARFFLTGKSTRFIEFERP